jgi:hypothetical protein
MHPEEGRAHTEEAHSHHHRERTDSHRALPRPQIGPTKAGATTSGVTVTVTVTDSTAKGKEIVPARDTQPVISIHMYRAMATPQIVREMHPNMQTTAVIIAGSRRGGEVGVPISGTRVGE